MKREAPQKTKYEVVFLTLQNMMMKNFEAFDVEAKDKHDIAIVKEIVV